MKKLTALFLILCMACMLVPALAEEDVTGDWTLYQMGIGGTMFDASTLGMDIVMHVNADGTVVQNGEIAGQNMDGSGTWTLEGDTLTIAMGKTPKVYTFADGMLSLEQDGKTVVFMKEAPAAEKFEKPETAAAAKEEDFFGSWRFESMDVAGVHLTKDLLPSLGISEKYDSIITIEAGRITTVTDADDGNGPQTLNGTTLFENGRLMITFEFPDDLKEIAKQYGLDQAKAELLADGNLWYTTSMMGIEANLYMIRVDTVSAD